MTITPEILNNYFDQYGWTYTQESEDTWITGVRTHISAFRIMVRITEHWVFFIINPLVVAPLREEDRLRVYYHALRYNLDMNFAKLGVDSDGDIFMAIELPTENFHYSHFVDALDGLSHHASMIYTELFSLAHNADNVEGRYDHEIDDDLLEFNPFDTDLDIGEDDDDDDDEGISFLSKHLRPTERDSGMDEDDIIIAGRRLKITDDEQGSARVELEDDDDEMNNPPADTDTSEDSTPRPKKSHRKSDGDSSEPPTPKK